MMKRIVSIAAFLLALCSSLAFAGAGVWTSEGPHGGRVDRLLVNPAAPAVLYASTQGGIFRSDDGGVSWARKMAGLTGAIYQTGAFAMDAEAPGTLWLFDSFGRLFRTTDGGENWAATGYTLPDTEWVVDIADAPGSIGTLYAASSSRGVLVSSDSGASFHPLGVGLPTGVAIGRIQVDPLDPQRIIAGLAYGTLDPLYPATVYLSTDGGANWSGVITLGGGAPYYGYLGDVDFGAGNRVYAAVYGGLFRSDDRGATWTQMLAGGLYGTVSVLADRTNADNVLLATAAGLARSTDGGATVTMLNSGLEMVAGQPALINAIAAHPAYPAVPQLWLGTEGAGVYFSANAGATWAARNEGLSATQIRALAMFHDAATHRLFAGYGDMFSPSPALFRGNTSGPGQPFTSWAPSNTNLDAYQIRALLIDPTTRAGGIGATRIYATGRSAIQWNDPVRNGGIYRSLDGGSTWSTIDAGLPLRGSPPAPDIGTVRNLVIDPRSCAAPPPSGPCTSGPLQTLYATSNGYSSAGTFSFRVIRSTDGGDSWTSRDNGIPQPIDPGGADPQSVLVVPIVINPVNPQELYVGTSASFDPTHTVPTIASGVFKSSDGGATWVHRSQGLPRFPGSATTTQDVLSLAINPSNPLELWCSVIDLSGLSGSSGGVFHTVDGGATWTETSNGLTSIDIRALYVDPANPATVYAAGGGTDGNPGSIFKTEDSGANWRSISIGLPANAALALQVDPVDPRVLYAGTNSGVWSLTQLPDADGDGIPDEVENAAPNGGDGNHNGIPDALESNVGSLTSVGSAPDAGTQARGGNDYFTVAIHPLEGTCTQAVDVQSVYAAYHGQDFSTYGDAYAYARQLARFEIIDCQRARAIVKFHGTTFGAGHVFRFFGPSTPGDSSTLGWHDFSTRATQVAPDTWELLLENGAFGSYRPASANAILFEGGPAWSEGIFRDGFN